MVERQNAAMTAATTHYETSLDVERLLDVTFSDSISAAVELPIGSAMYGLKWPNLSTPVTIRLQVAESVGGTYAVLRKADGSGEFDPYNGTSSSAKGAIFVSDLAPFKFVKIDLDGALETTYTWNWIVKH